MKIIPTRSTAIGIVTKDRNDFTSLTLQSLYLTQEPKSDYDLFIFDNASKDVTVLHEAAQSNLLPIKNIYLLEKEMSLSRIWNLFLCITQEYKYRVKLDNDIVFAHTVPPPPKPGKSPIDNPNPGEVDPLAGAPRSGAIIGGGATSGSTPLTSLRGKPRNRRISQFLRLMKEFHKEHNVDIVGLVPVIPKHNFGATWAQYISQQINGISYLAGGCVLITQKAYNTIGYFDERLEANVDVEYTQRALRNSLNIGYHPEYWVTHIGAKKDTKERRKEKNHALGILLNDPRIDKIISPWEKVIWKVLTAAKKNKVVHLK